MTKRKRISPINLDFLRELMKHAFITTSDMQKKIGRDYDSVRKIYKKLKERGFPIFRKKFKINGRKQVVYYLDLRRVERDVR